MNTETFRVVKKEFEDSDDSYLCNGSPIFKALWKNPRKRDTIKEKARQFLLNNRSFRSNVTVSEGNHVDSCLFNSENPRNATNVRLAFLNWLISESQTTQ
jgi:hypothetical protein